MKSRKIVTYLAFAIFIVPMLTACGPKTIDVAMTTYKITPSTTEANAGEITFHVHNDATDLTHEFVIFKTDLAPDQLPVDADGVVDEAGAGLTFVDEVEDVTPGTSQDLTVTLDPGNYVLVCNANDNNEMHYAHGMYIGFTVK